MSHVISIIILHIRCLTATHSLMSGGGLRLAVPCDAAGTSREISLLSTRNKSTGYQIAKGALRGFLHSDIRLIIKKHGGKS